MSTLTAYRRGGLDDRTCLAGASATAGTGAKACGWRVCCFSLLLTLMSSQGRQGLVAGAATAYFPAPVSICKERHEGMVPQ